MKKTILAVSLLQLSQGAFAAPYVCSMTSKVGGHLADLFAVKVELTSGMTQMAQIAKEGSVPVYGRAGIKQSGDNLIMEIDVGKKPLEVTVVQGKAGAELSYSFSNSADKAIFVHCEPL